LATAVALQIASGERSSTLANEISVCARALTERQSNAVKPEIPNIRSKVLSPD
jgi:hypothetical protein